MEPVGCQVDAAAGREGAFAPPERVLADCIEDDVVGLAVPGEVFLRVVDHPVGSQRSHELEAPRAAYRRDIDFEVPGQLYPGGADGTGCAVDEDLLALAQICLPQAPQRVESSVADRRSLLEAHPSRHVGDEAVLLHADELRVCPEPEPAAAEDVLTDRKLVDRCADGFDLSRQLVAEDALPRSAEAGDQAAEEHYGQTAPSVGFTRRAVRPGDCRGTDLDADLVLPGKGCSTSASRSTSGGPYRS